MVRYLLGDLLIIASILTQYEIILLEHEYITVGKIKRDLVTRCEILLLARA